MQNLINGNYTIMDMNSISQQLNNLTFTDYFYRLMLIARTVFKWNNLPEGIDEKWIEQYLFSEGKCMFYHDKTTGYMVAKCTTEGLNYYDEPTQLRPVGTNLENKESLENNVDAILIRNNDEMLPTSPTIQIYACRLAELSRTIDTNIMAQKTPVIIKCTDKQKQSLKQVYAKWNGNEPVIFGDKTLELDKFNVLKADAPIVFDKLQIQKHAIWNEAMTYLGINNANMDKRERLVDDEVQANNEQIEMSAQVMLKSREKACELINKMFGLNISVELRKPAIEFMDDIDDRPNDSEGSEPLGRGA